MDLMMLDELVVPRVPLHDASFVLFECIPIELKHSVVNTHVVPYVQLFWGTVLWGFARCDGDENGFHYRGTRRRTPASSVD